MTTAEHDLTLDDVEVSTGEPLLHAGAVARFCRLVNECVGTEVLDPAELDLSAVVEIFNKAQERGLADITSVGVMVNVLQYDWRQAAEETGRTPKEVHELLRDFSSVVAQHRLFEATQPHQDLQSEVVESPQDEQRFERMARLQSVQRRVDLTAVAFGVPEEIRGDVVRTYREVLGAIDDLMKVAQVDQYHKFYKGSREVAGVMGAYLSAESRPVDLAQRLGMSHLEFQNNLVPLRRRFGQILQLADYWNTDFTEEERFEALEHAYEITLPLRGSMGRRAAAAVGREQRQKSGMRELFLLEPKGDEDDWQSRALCAQTDPEAFFPEKGGSTKEAKRVCLTCEVRQDCLEYSLFNDERFGVWGGLSERERRKLKKRAI